MNTLSSVSEYLLSNSAVVREAQARNQKRMRQVGDLIRQARKRKGMSQERLEELTEVSQATLSALERGTRPDPGVITLTRIAQALGIEAELAVLMPLLGASASKPPAASSETGSPWQAIAELEAGAQATAKALRTLERRLKKLEKLQGSKPVPRRRASGQQR